VPDRELADHIRSLPYYQKDGKFDAEAYSKLPERGLEERRRRERLLISRFQNYIVERIRLTPAEMKRAFLMKETKVDLDYAKIDFQALAGNYKPTNKEVDDFLKSTPENELQQYFDAHKADFTDKAQVSLRQIRVAIPYQASEVQKSEARKKAESIAKELTPANFAELARRRSDDEYAKKGGNVGWIARGTLEKPLEEVVDRMEIGKVSPPVETTFGYFIVQLADKKNEVVHPLAEVKRKIAERLAVEKYRKGFAEKKRAEWEKVLADGKNLEPELKRARVEIKKTGPFSIGQGYIPNIGQADSIMDSIFALTPAKPVAKRLFNHQDAYYFIKLRSIEFPKEGDFAKAKDSIEKNEGTALQTELITTWVNSLQKQASIKTELPLSRGM
jgi:peptidyl-prolyl cis-trans isomerase D